MSDDTRAPSDAKDCNRVLIVSDVLLYREGVAAGLAGSGGLAVAGAVRSEQALAVALRERLDAVLIDASAPRALAIAREIKARLPHLALVGFGITSDDGSLACAEAGVTGFVGRDGTIADLVIAVHNALLGEVRCTPRLAALLCARLAALSRVDDPCHSESTLTPREQQIADLVSKGLSNKEIAISIEIGPATVKNHIHNILEKLNVPRRGAVGARLQAMARARSPGLARTRPSQTGVAHVNVAVTAQ